MDRFLIITNIEKDKDFKITNKLADYIHKAGKEVVLSQLSLEQGEDQSDIDYSRIECAIVLGGDGTIILAANELKKHDIPILGVNLGTVGFLAEIEEHKVYEALEHLFHNQYRIENRLMVHGDIHYNSKPTAENLIGHALNDVVITRKGFSRIISLGIYVNDELLDVFRGDGVIISTPTGSTAYNLSAGGPIIIPQASVMVITPICPHSLSPRSVVVAADDIIKVVVRRSKKSQEAEAMVSFDGSKEIDLGTDDEVTIRKSIYQTKLVKLSHTGVYDILRTKLSNNIDNINE